MAHLALVGTHAVNGVAELHIAPTHRDGAARFAELWLERSHNVTNGVTPRWFSSRAIRAHVELLNERSAMAG